MFERQEQVTVVTGEIIAIDLDAKTVTTDAGTLGPADHLVIAAGRSPTSTASPAPPSTPFRSTRSATRSGCAFTSGTGSASSADLTPTAA